MFFKFKLTQMQKRITDIVWTDDSRLLQESNLTARQLRRVPLHVIHLILLAPPPSEWRTSQPYGGYGAQTQVPQHRTPRCYHYSMAQCMVQLFVRRLVPHGDA